MKEDLSASLQLLKDEISRYQEYLDECSFITSHVFRAHIARIIGLINLIDVGHPSELENEKILIKLKNEIRELNKALMRAKKSVEESFLEIYE